MRTPEKGGKLEQRVGQCKLKQKLEEEDHSGGIRTVESAYLRQLGVFESSKGENSLNNAASWGGEKK